MPGQSLSEEREEVIENSVGQPLLLALFLMLVAALEWWRVYTGMKPNPTVFTIAAAIGIGYAGLRIWFAAPKLRALRQGLEGEKAVGQYLERLRGSGYQVFHDIVGATFNIDHVIVGPSGVFTIETKTWSKPADGDAQINFDGETVRVGSYEPERDPVTQAKAQAGWLRELLYESTGRKFEVRPVIVFPGWFVVNSKSSFRDIWVLEPKALPPFLANEPLRLPAEDVKLVSFHLSRLIRSTERDRERTKG